MKRTPLSLILTITLPGLALTTACSDQSLDPWGDGPAASTTTELMEQVGEAIFFDENLSINGNQSCASCHDPDWGFTGPDAPTNAAGAVYEGSIPGSFGDRRPPTAAYATQSPILHLYKDTWTGGNFWDGRATGEVLGNPAADQARGPFINPVEQALPDLACVVYRVSVAVYANDFAALWDNEIFGIHFPANTDAECATGNPVNLSAADRTAAGRQYDNIALTIAAYEASPLVNAFTSKFDAWRRGQAQLTLEELRGFGLFQGRGKCSRCHPGNGQQPLFTDYTYDNLGVPINPLNPAYIASGFIDPGLGGFLGDADELGKMKVPTLRNVDRRPSPGAVKAFAHNGVFKSLKQIVHFYNTRDVLPTCPTLTDPGFGVTCWPPPEQVLNVNTDELGDLGLTDAEEDAIVAFLRTLSDGYWVR